MIMNFNVALENPDKYNGFITDRWTITRQYLLGWFGLDLVATIPFDIILDNSIQSSVFLKNVKSVRLIKIVKLLKLLRLTKAYTFLNMSAFWDTEYGKEIMQFSKKHKGLYQLLWIILSLMIVTH